VHALRRIAFGRDNTGSFIDRAEGLHRPMVSVERFAFYDAARASYAVIQTGERRFYGCFLFRKGVIPPDA
jgi:L-fucose mutarotase